MEGDKVKVTLMFRGREIVHTEFGRDQLDKVKGMLADIAAVENPPRMEGRFLSMILVPNREAIARLERLRAAQAAEAGEELEPAPPADAEDDDDDDDDDEAEAEEAEAAGDE
jgi:translation initiation factor IF-3